MSITNPITGAMGTTEANGCNTVTYPITEIGAGGQITFPKPSESPTEMWDAGMGGGER